VEEMPYTPNYDLRYIGVLTEQNVDADGEERNWTFVDWQLYGINSMMGDGVLTGWTVAAATGLYVDVSPGSGLVKGYFAETAVLTEDVLVDDDTTTYIFALATDDTATTGEVTFVASSLPTMTDAVLLATVVAVDGAITTVTNSVKTSAGFTGTLRYYLEHHKHDNNPIAFIDLTTDVTGILPAANMGPIPSSKLTGLISVASIPQQDHADLDGVGSYTHDELDDFVDTITDDRYKEFGDVVAVIVGQKMLSEAHIYYESADPGGYFRFIPNLALFIPGITCKVASADTPNYTDLIDIALTTATIDEVNRLFKTGLGVALATPKVYSQNWNTQAEWETSVSQTNVVITNRVTLSVLSSTTTYNSSGTLVFKYDSGRISEFTLITWSVVSGGITTPISVRTRTANTEALLASATWSTAITASGDAVTSEDNRWIEIEVTISTTDTSISPILDWVQIDYEAVGGGCGRVLWPTFEDFNDGTCVDTVVVTNTVKLDTTGTGTYPSTGTATSDVIDPGAAFTEWVSLTWVELLQTGTDLLLYYRDHANATTLLTLPWQGPFTDAVGGVDLSGETGRYIQVKLEFSTSDTSVTPTFDEMTLIYKE
jgi:hypothetical protein